MHCNYKNAMRKEDFKTILEQTLPENIYDISGAVKIPAFLNKTAYIEYILKLIYD